MKSELSDSASEFLGRVRDATGRERHDVRSAAVLERLFSEGSSGVHDVSVSKPDVPLRSAASGAAKKTALLSKLHLGVVGIAIGMSLTGGYLLRGVESKNAVQAAPLAHAALFKNFVMSNDTSPPTLRVSRLGPPRVLQGNSAPRNEKSSTERLELSPLAGAAPDGRLGHLGEELRLLKLTRSALDSGDLSRAQQGIEDHRRLAEPRFLTTEFLAARALLQCKRGDVAQARSSVLELKNRSKQAALAVLSRCPAVECKECEH